MSISTLTSKGQATIPAEVRKKLELKAGDKVMFEIIDHNVVLRKAQAFDLEYHQALSQTLSEWSSTEDDEAYGDL
ncbi:MAG: AbrB/MazE/SpoVT family DNA-binding domain-containing protein [Legionellales bacterium]|nr:AbrB/MazE/SpoVT family DNA-binding domain-containing protein [Legionellales bacterium]